MTGDLNKIYVKIGATRANINFLTKCRKYNLIPKGFISKQRIFTRKSGDMELRFARIRMREMLNSLHAKLFLLELDAKVAPAKDKYSTLTNFLKKAQNREYFKRMKIFDKKFARMMSERKNRPAVQFKMDAVLNLSSKELSPEEKRVLARGFKFRPTLNEIPVTDLIIGTETLIKSANIPADVATKIRNITVVELKRMQSLEKRRPTKKNLSKKEWVAVQSLAADKITRIVPADKGDKSIVTDYGLQALEANENESAIINEDSYLGKLKDRISSHEHIDDNPATSHEKKLNATLRKMHQVGKDSPKTKDKDNPPLILSRESLTQYITEGAIPPQLRGQIKDHKQGTL